MLATMILSGTLCAGLFMTRWMNAQLGCVDATGLVDVYRTPGGVIIRERELPGKRYVDPRRRPIDEAPAQEEKPPPQGASPYFVS